MNLKNQGFKLLAGGMAVLFSYTVSVPAWAGTSSFPQVVETLDVNILKSRTVSELSDVFGNATTALFSIVKEEISQEENREMVSVTDGAINKLNLSLAELGAQLEDLKNYAHEVRSSTRANQMARTLMHEFYYNHLLKRFQDAPFKGLSAGAKRHAFHVIKDHIEKGDVASFLKEVEMMEDQTSQGFYGGGGWLALPIGGLVMLILLIWYYSKEENSFSRDVGEFWAQVKKFFCE